MNPDTSCGQESANDWDNENAAAFEIEYAGMIGRAATAEFDRMLTIAPCDRVNSGRNAWVTP